ncbi:hypothetical protein CBR_g22140 [Chara braunii]|uniref:CCHC-type domain-containing protein n=1 Tax=Chara braunii TaxID=69332 RepID=A0A388L2G6_CHABU|nr:hypothetical protein CBR_g22140 [Chara braunii]|eukprot:GBG76393.1 hypothetical protein CBR_g22140 [Chara braunii]
MNNGGNTGNGGYGGRTPLTCYECGKPGHIARDCWSKRGRPQQQEDEVHTFVRELMEEKKEERRKRAEEEQRRLREEEERKQKLDIARRTEEMKLQLQAEIEEKWRKQQQEAAMIANENKQGTTKDISPVVTRNASLKLSLRNKIIVKEKTKKRSSRQSKKRRGGKRVVETSSDIDDSGTTSDDSSEDTDDEILRIAHKLREEKQRAKAKKKLPKSRSKIETKTFEVVSDLWRSLRIDMEQRWTLRERGIGGEEAAVVERRITLSVMLLGMTGEIRWLSKYLDKAELTEDLLELQSGGTYVIVSPWPKRTYVGCTTRPIIHRWREHVAAARSNALGKAPQLYRWMRTFGVDKFLVVPIRHTTEQDDFVFERTARGRRTPILNWLEEKKDKPGERFEIEFLPGKHWIDDWKTLESKFGASEILIGGRKMTFKEAKRLCQQGGIAIFLKVRRTNTTTERNKVFLSKLLSQPGRMSSLRGFTTAKLDGLYRTAGLFGRKDTCNKLKITLDKVIRQKTGVSVRRKVTVRYLYSDCVLKSQVRKITENVVEAKVTEEAVAGFVKNKVRIVCTKNKTVGDIINNHKNYAHTGTVVCRCQEFSLAKQDGHVLTRLLEVKDVPDFVRNAKNVTRPDSTLSKKSLEKGITDATAHLKGRCQKEVDVDSCYGERTRSNDVWTEREVRTWIARYDGLVLAPIDRNPGDIALICPVLYRHGFGKTFVWNADYEKTDKTEEEILKVCKEDYARAGLGAVGKWNAAGKLGRTYVIPKDKDLQRWRPIAPACTDLAGTGQRRCARALHCLVRRFSRKNSFHFGSTYEMKDELQPTEELFQKEGYTAVI